MFNFIKTIKINYFYFGLIILFLIQIISPNKIIYFSSYFFSTLIIALSSDLDILDNLYIFGIFILFLLPLSFGKKNQTIQSADIFVFLFLIWNYFTSFFHSFNNTIIGVTVLSEISVLYFFLRIHLNLKYLKPVIYLFISILLFQNIIGSTQALIGRNIGLLTEAATETYPYGITALEERNIFRITASYSHANIYAIILISLLPMLFFSNNMFIYAIRSVWIANLLFTSSRSAWIVGFSIYLFLSIKEYQRVKFTNVRNHKIKLILISFIFILLSPFIIIRLFTIPQALDEQGSFGSRIKLAKEAINIISQTPVIGIGINRFQEIASYNPVTNLFPVNEFTSSTKVHNLFLEIAVSSGLPALILFTFFLFSVYKSYLKIKSPAEKNLKYFFLLGLFTLILISFFHPVYLGNQFRLFFLLGALILV